MIGIHSCIIFSNRLSQSRTYTSDSSRGVVADRESVCILLLNNSLSSDSSSLKISPFYWLSVLCDEFGHVYHLNIGSSLQKATHRPSEFKNLIFSFGNFSHRHGYVSFLILNLFESSQLSSVAINSSN